MCSSSTRETRLGLRMTIDMFRLLGRRSEI